MSILACLTGLTFNPLIDFNVTTLYLRVVVLQTRTHYMILYSRPLHIIYTYTSYIYVRRDQANILHHTFPLHIHVHIYVYMYICIYMYRCVDVYIYYMYVETRPHTTSRSPHTFPNQSPHTLSPITAHHHHH